MQKAKGGRYSAQIYPILFNKHSFMTGGRKTLLSLDGTAFLEILDRLFVAEVRHSLLWPETTAFLKLQRNYSRSENTTVSLD